MAGIFAVVAGVFFIAGGTGLFRAAHDPAKRAGIRTGMLYGLLTGVFIASYTVVDGYAVKFVLMSPILLDYYGNFVRLLFLLPTVLRDRATAARHWRKQWKHALVVATHQPDRLRARALCHEGRAALARCARARGLDAVRRADRRTIAWRA